MKWIDIRDHPGYQVSDSYGVQSLDRTIEGRHGIVKGRELATWIVRGQRVVKLGAGRVYRVADLVEAAFGSKPAEAVKVPTCSRGHSLEGAKTWGVHNRVCADCAAGKPRVRELPEII